MPGSNCNTSGLAWSPPAVRSSKILRPNLNMKKVSRTCSGLLLALLVCQPQVVLAAGVPPPDPTPDVRFGALEAWM